MQTQTHTHYDEHKLQHLKLLKNYYKNIILNYKDIIVSFHQHTKRMKMNFVDFNNVLQYL